MIYCIEADGIGIKIGFTDGTVEDRIRSLQTGCPVELRSRWTLTVGQCHESDAHLFFRPFRLRGEWFSMDIAETADRLASDEQFRALAYRFSTLSEYRKSALLELAQVESEADFIVQCAELPVVTLRGLIDSVVALRHVESSRHTLKSIRATDRQWAAWKRAANSAGIGLQQWIRQALDGAAQIPPPSE